MQTNSVVNNCLDSILYENVAGVEFAFQQIYFWLAKEYPGDNLGSFLQAFLDSIGEALSNEAYIRQPFQPEKVKRKYWNAEEITADIQTHFQGIPVNQAIQLLGELVGAYARSVPEPLFRAEPRYWGLHQTPDTPAQDDMLPMTDGMIFFAWEYFWFYTWLGY